VSTRVVDPRRLRWFHFFPLLAGAGAILWLACVKAYPAVAAADRWYRHAAWLAVAAVAMSVLVSFLCRNRTGLGTPVAQWLRVIWGKDTAIGVQAKHSAGAWDTGLGSMDWCVLGAAACALTYLGWRSGRDFDMDYAGAVALAAVAVLGLASFPGVPAVSLERWGLRPVATHDPRTANLIELLQSRIGKIDRSPAILETGTPEAVLNALRANGVAAATGGKGLVREYSVSMVRTPVALDPGTLCAEPQVVGVELLSLAVDSDRLDALRVKNRSQPLAFRQSLDDHIVHSRSDEIFQLCVALEAMFRKYQLTPWDRLQTILGFCQTPNIRYVLDESQASIRDLGGSRIDEYCRYPLETLVDKQGDCDCHSVLAACLFHTLGYECCVFSIGAKDGGSSHMAVGVMPPGANVLLPEPMAPPIDGRRYYYCETTGSWQIGRMPDGFDAQTLRVWWPRKN
jgi:hypothetical protein